MKKAEAVRVLGGTVSRAARELRVTPSAVSQWPDDGDIPEHAENRVLAWLARRHLPIQEMLAAKSDAGGTPLGEEAAAEPADSAGPLPVSTQRVA